MKVKPSYRVRLREYLYFANRMKRNNCAVYLSSKGAFSGVDFMECETGKHPFEVLHAWESTGKKFACNNVKALRWLVIGKFARDWHITEWSAAIKAGILTINELECPKSVVESIKRVIYK